MSRFRALRSTERWFKLGLWLIALLFAGFLTDLGQLVIRDLPQVEPEPAIESLLDPADVARWETGIDTLQRKLKDHQDAIDRLELQHAAASRNYSAGRDAFSNWIASRSSTGRSDHDPDIIARTQELDALRQTTRKALAEVEAVQAERLRDQQALTRLQNERAEAMQAASTRLESLRQAQQLKVFGLRLAATLPLVVIAAWLFRRHRHSRFWPFVWGFILFALNAFFFELVPYLPSYGGYVRTAVGLVVTAVGGYWAVRGAQAWLDRKRAAEAQSEPERRSALGYEEAIKAMSRHACPACERTFNLADAGATNFCMHCGLKLFQPCHHCGFRHNAFFRFCPQCGTSPEAPGGPAE